MSEDIFEEEEQIAQEQASVEARVLRQTMRDLPTLQPPMTCERSTTIRQAIEIMQRERIDCVLVVDLGRLVGVFTAWDVLTKVAARRVDIDHLRIETLMTPDPDCLHMDDELAYALHQMSVWDYQHIPLIDDQGRPTGGRLHAARYRATPGRSVKTWQLAMAHLAVDVDSRGTVNIMTLLAIPLTTSYPGGGLVVGQDRLCRVRAHPGSGDGDQRHMMS